MAISYKQKCFSCKKNYVLATRHQRFPLCYECQKKELEGEIKDPAMKKLFAVPEDFYQKSAFLRSIKVNYLKYGNLSEKQIDTFKKVAEKLKDDAVSKAKEVKEAAKKKTSQK